MSINLFLSNEFLFFSGIQFYYFLVKNYNIETIRPILYSFQAIGLQIFCTLAINLIYIYIYMYKRFLRKGNIFEDHMSDFDFFF